MFEGSFVALVTPFKDDESLDEAKLKELIEFQIDGGTHGIVPCGTTGESPSLSEEEHDRVIEITVDTVNGRVPIIAGTGSNSTARTSASNGARKSPRRCRCCAHRNAVL